MICKPRRGLPSRACCKSWTRGWDSLVPSTMWLLIIFLPRPFQRRFSCTKHSAMAPLPTITPCYWLRRDVIIYMALNGGVKMLSHPRVRHHRMRQHFPRRANFGYRSVSSGRKFFLTLETGISAHFDVRRNVVPPWRVRQAHSGSNSPMTSQNVNANQSRKVASSVRFRHILHVFRQE